MVKYATWSKEDRPLGCNGHHGNSGYNKHYRNGTPYCDDCRASAAHQTWVKRTERRHLPLSRKAARADQQIRAIREVRRSGRPLVLGCNGKFGESGYNKHRRAGTVPCRKCLDSRAQWYQHKKPIREVIPVNRAECGTIRAAWQHKRRRETLDEPCREAIRAYDREQKRKQKQRKRGSK